MAAARQHRDYRSEADRESEKMGKLLHAGLVDLAGTNYRRHPHGAAAGDRAGQNVRRAGDQRLVQPGSEANGRLSATLRQEGEHLVRWDWCSRPAAGDQRGQIGEGLAILDKALDIVDEYCKVKKPSFSDRSLATH
jgi:hypothetical protein